MTRIKRNICTASFEYSQESYNHLKTAIEKKRDQVACADPAFA